MHWSWGLHMLRIVNQSSTLRDTCMSSVTITTLHCPSGESTCMRERFIITTHVKLANSHLSHPTPSKVHDWAGLGIQVLWEKSNILPTIVYPLRAVWMPLSVTPFIAVHHFRNKCNCILPSPFRCSFKLGSLVLPREYKNQKNMRLLHVIIK